MEKLREQIETLIDKAESTRGYSLWLGAPDVVTDAIQSALDALYLASGLVDKELERKKQGELDMKDLCDMLAKYQAARETILETSKRLDKVQEVCAKCNEGLDKFFVDAETICVPTMETETSPLDEEVIARNGTDGQPQGAV